MPGQTPENTKNMTLKDAKILLRKIAITVTSKPHTGEYRVNFDGGAEATACYETDLAGAVGTAQAMAKHRDANAAVAGRGTSSIH